MRTVASLHSLHPEELLDRDVRGTLSASDRARLEDHLAQCSACRLERQLRDDFADELGSDVTPSSVERLTLASVSQPRAPMADALTPPPTKRAQPRRRVTRATWLLAAAAVFAVSAASATNAPAVVQRAWSQLVGTPDVQVPVAAAPAPRHAVRHHAQPAGDPRPAEAAALPREVPSTDVLAPPAAPAQALVARAAHPHTASAAAALFDAATDARRHGDYGRALTLQHDLQARFPRSHEAHVSRATLGRLLLDRGDPAGALASFDAYLGAGSGDLGEEAMIGRATALERLGRTSDAARAWAALLAAYPQTSYAAHAKARLGGPSVR